MSRRGHKQEEFVVKLRQVDVLVSQVQTMSEAVRTIGVMQFTYYLNGRLSRCKSMMALAA